MHYIDIHNHMLFGVDDGARTDMEMYQMIDASYADGVRHICFTPHYHPGYFGEHQEQILIAYDIARQYVSTRYTDLTLYLGNELRFGQSFFEWLDEGKCRTLNGTKHLLVDFLYHESAENILGAIPRIINSGYIPVLAHVERYERLHKDMREIEQFKSWGVYLQVDAQSPIGGLGFSSKVRSRRLLDIGAVDLIASDAHNLHSRPPELHLCYDYIAHRYGKSYANQLFIDRPLQLLTKK